ncbi:hypothetical protein B2G51_03155 [Leptospira santarosai]|nr:hypothetical protein B2G51_03155 [Leptospira santarosai]
MELFRKKIRTQTFLSREAVKITNQDGEKQGFSNSNLKIDDLKKRFELTFTTILISIYIFV